MFGKLSVVISAVLAIGSTLPVFYENPDHILPHDVREALVRRVPSMVYHPLPLGLQQSAASAFSQSLDRNFGMASSFAQNLGNSGLSLSSAQSYNGYAPAVGLPNNAWGQYHGLKPSLAGSQTNALVQNQGLKPALAQNNILNQNQGLKPTVAQNNALNQIFKPAGYQQSQAHAVASQFYNGNKGFESALSSASSNGLGRGLAQSVAQNVGGSESAISVSQNQGWNNFGSAISAANNFRDYGSSFAQSAQQNGRRVQQSGASSINGFQASQSHAINSGF